MRVKDIRDLIMDLDDNTPVPDLDERSRWGSRTVSQVFFLSSLREL
jgi:hypothetical protein